MFLKRVPHLFLAALSGLILSIGGVSSLAADKVFKAAAVKVDTSPELGVSLNGGMQDRTATEIHDPLHARCLVLNDGKNSLAFVIVDSCMIPREVFDTAKLIASEKTGIPTSNMMMSATHTHTAPTSADVFQSDSNGNYKHFLIEKIAEAIVTAHKNLRPARIGWGKGSEPDHVFNRRWHLDPEITLKNPFGREELVRMNPSPGDKSLIKPAGPIDPLVHVVSVVSTNGTPIGVLANYSLHYVGGTLGGHVSADYYGVFARKLASIIGADTGGEKGFVAMMSNGTSGDINNINFYRPRVRKQPYEQIELVGDVVAAEAYKVWRQIEYNDWVPLGALEQEITLATRKPDEADIQYAKDVLERHAVKKIPRLATREEIYAGETMDMTLYPPLVDLKLQAFRIGDLSVAAIPCETFVEIGLELRLNSPFKDHFTISLANGYNGYLPTRKHHELGGYETWRAKSSYLGVDSAHKVVATLTDLMDKLNR